MKTDFESATLAWLQARDELQISLVTPFYLVAKQKKYDYLAWLPDFGGRKGMLLIAMSPPGSEADLYQAQVAKEHGYYYSTLNPARHSTFDKPRFIDALVDWGYSGPMERRPVWMVER